MCVLRRFLDAYGKDMGMLELTRLWTRKEAVFKLAGDTDRDRLHLSDRISMRNDHGIIFSEKVMDRGEVLTVAVKDAISSVSIKAVAEWVSCGLKIWEAAFPVLRSNNICHAFRNRVGITDYEPVWICLDEEGFSVEKVSGCIPPDLYAV